MSKVTAYVDKVKELKPKPFKLGDFEAAFVTEQGMLEISRGGFMKAKDAVRLAEWIKENFG